VTGAVLVMISGCASADTHSSTGEYIDDTLITAKVKTAIANDPDLKVTEINVETFKGVVQLSSFVSTRAQMNRAVVAEFQKLFPDSGATFHLGRSTYTKLLQAGVEIYERQGAVIDGVWSTIGSSNLDMRSFLHNDDINAVVLRREFAMQMDAMFAADVAESERILLKQWRRRPLWLRVKEQVARIGAY